MADRWICTKQKLAAAAAAALEPLPLLSPPPRSSEILAVLSAIEELSPGTGWQPETSTLRALDEATLSALANDRCMGDTD